MKAAQMNGQSGWGLTEEDSDEGKTKQKSQFNRIIYRIIIRFLMIFQASSFLFALTLSV